MDGRRRTVNRLPSTIVGGEEEGAGGGGKGNRTVFSVTCQDTSLRGDAVKEHSDGKQMRAGVEVATLGGGCFWCLEPVFEALAGVQNVVVGYAGGSIANPSYRQVGSGATGHAEVVQVEFDPSQISYREILEAFFVVHDPTTPNRRFASWRLRVFEWLRKWNRSPRITWRRTTTRITSIRILMQATVGW